MYMLSNKDDAEVLLSDVHSTTNTKLSLKFFTGEYLKQKEELKLCTEISLLELCWAIHRNKFWSCKLSVSCTKKFLVSLRIQMLISSIFSQQHFINLSFCTSLQESASCFLPYLLHDSEMVKCTPKFDCKDYLDFPFIKDGKGYHWFLSQSHVFGRPVQSFHFFREEIVICFCW